jgi:hypothetical protein
MDGMSVDLRRSIFRHFADTGAPPELTRAELARLASEHAVALDAEGRLAFANPFARGPAAYRVTTPSRSYAAVCVWDALGIAALTGADARIDADCPDCGEPLSLEVAAGELAATAHVVHFLVPAARWYDDLAFT